MKAQQIQDRVTKIIETCMGEPSLNDKLFRGVETLEKDVLRHLSMKADKSESNKRRMAHINPRQLEILKKVVVALGKKLEAVDEYIQNMFNENRESWKGGDKCIQTNENGEITMRL